MRDHITDLDKCVRAKVDATVRRWERKRFEAWPTSAGSDGVRGEGETAAEAVADLERNLAWIAHFVGARVAYDGAGVPHVCTVAAYHGTWHVTRRDSAGTSGGSLTNAPSWSKLKEIIASWDVPDPRRYSVNGEDPIEYGALIHDNTLHGAFMPHAFMAHIDALKVGETFGGGAGGDVKRVA